jgi:hypothetical protein
MLRSKRRGGPTKDPPRVNKNQEIQMFEYESNDGMHRIPDHDTSVEAAGAAATTRAQMKALVYRILAEDCMTDQELLYAIRALGIPAAYSSPGKRRGDLVAEGLVIDSGDRRPNDNGRNMIVWCAVEVAA